MSWNHRVMARKYDNEIIFDMYEVYYNEEGVPNGCTCESVKPGGWDNMEDFKFTLDKMQLALDKPIIWYGDKFPQEYKPKK